MNQSSSHGNGPTVSVAERRQQFSRRSTVPNLKPLMRERFGDYYQVDEKVVIDNDNSTSPRGLHRANQCIIRGTQLATKHKHSPSDENWVEKRQFSTVSSQSSIPSPTPCLCLEEYDSKSGSFRSAFSLTLKKKLQSNNYKNDVADTDENDKKSPTSCDTQLTEAESDMVNSGASRPISQESCRRANANHHSSPEDALTDSDSDSIASDMSPIMLSNYSVKDTPEYPEKLKESGFLLRPLQVEINETLDSNSTYSEEIQWGDNITENNDQWFQPITTSFSPILFSRQKSIDDDRKKISQATTKKVSSRAQTAKVLNKNKSKRSMGFNCQCM